MQNIMIKFFTPLLNLRRTSNIDLLKDSILKTFDSLSSYLFSVKNIISLRKDYINKYTENLMIDSNYNGTQFHFNI